MAPMTEGLAFRTVAGRYRGEDSLLQLLELREAVETGLVSRLAGRVPPDDLAELDALVDRMNTEAGTGLAETDRAFHATLYRGLGNLLLSELLEAFWDACHRVRTDLVELPQDPKVTCRQHREILDTVRSGDAIRAEEAIREHFGNIHTRLTATAPNETIRHPNKRV